MDGQELLANLLNSFRFFFLFFYLACILNFQKSDLWVSKCYLLGSNHEIIFPLSLVAMTILTKIGFLFDDWQSCCPQSDVSC